MHVRRVQRSARLFVIALLGLSTVASTAWAAWPPSEDADFTDPKNWPNDPGYGSQWNLWSFVPKAWQENIRPAEIPMGTGISADKAWTVTTGDRRVVIAVLDSGINWDNGDLVNKFYLNRGELPKPDAACQTDGYDAGKDPWDANGDGVFNMLDYSKQAWPAIPKEACHPGVSDLNGNGQLDPEDLILNPLFSNGKDDDGDGYIDDISGWDFFHNDNNPKDDTRFGHGTGEARDSSADGGDGRGDIGVCPRCTVLMCRVGDSFVVDVNDFSGAVIFAVDSGASVVQEALGSLNKTAYSNAALEYAYANNTVIIASAADELSFHHNMPGTANHTVYVHAVVHDKKAEEASTTFLNFNNCTNYGGQLVLSTPGGGCSSEATGITSGHAGLIYSAALKANVDPPLSSEEVRGLLILSSDDIDVPESKTDPTKFPSGPGWDLHFGYGRNNAYKSVKMVVDDAIPPEADIAEPYWFEPIHFERTPKVDITGHIGTRIDGKAPRYASYKWELTVAKGVDPKSGWSLLDSGETPGLAGKITTWDLADAVKSVDWTAPLVDHDQYTFTLRLTVTAKNKAGKNLLGEFRKTVGLYKDKTLLSAFPKRVDVSGEASPKFVDLDADGKDELLYPLADGSLHAWKADGTELAGWPVWTDVRPELDAKNPANHLKACAYRADKTGCIKTSGGALPGGWRESMVGATPAVGDLDKDGKLDIVLTSWDGKVYAWGTDGKPKAGWPVEIDRKNAENTDPDHLWESGFFASATLADLDKDGKLEVIAPAMDQHVYVYRFDGTAQPGWPVKVTDPKLKGAMGDRIVTTAAVGDVDGDGELEIATGTNENFGSPIANEGRGYLLHHDGNLHAGGPIVKGFPIATFGLEDSVLPTVGRGVPGNPVMADIDFDGKLELNFDAIGAPGSFFTWQGKKFCWKIDGKDQCSLNNKKFGAKSNTKDSPGYILINNGAIGKIDPTGGLDFVKGTAGFNFALTFASGGERAVFDHHLSAWDTQTSLLLEGWPRVVDDWQFFMNPAIVDVGNDAFPEVISGSGGYLVRAWDWQGEEAPGFPKYTNGWIIPSPALGDIDGDGVFEVATGTRDGWVFVWKTEGKVAGGNVEWPNASHDLHNTNNYHAPINPYAKPATGGDTAGQDAGSTAETTPLVDAGSTGDLGAVQDAGGADAGVTPPPADDGGCSTRGAAVDEGAWATAIVLAMASLALRRRKG